MYKQTINIAIGAIIGALYYALMVFLAPLSFLAVQVRVAECLKMLVAVFPIPALIGTIIGTFLGNVGSPLGAIDLISPIFAFISLLPLVCIKKWCKNEKHLPAMIMLGGIIYCIGITSWVAFALQYSFGLPYGITWVTVFIGEIIAVLGIGYPMQAVVKRYFFPTNDRGLARSLNTAPAE